LGTVLTSIASDEASRAFVAWLQRGRPPPARRSRRVDAGMVVVNFNPLNTPREFEHQLTGGRQSRPFARRALISSIDATAVSAGPSGAVRTDAQAGSAVAGELRHGGRERVEELGRSKPDSFVRCLR